MKILMNDYEELKIIKNWKIEKLNILKIWKIENFEKLKILDNLMLYVLTKEMCKI